jgi:hypothetical protein
MLKMDAYQRYHPSQSTISHGSADRIAEAYQTSHPSAAQQTSSGGFHLSEQGRDCIIFGIWAGITAITLGAGLYAALGTEAAVGSAEGLSAIVGPEIPVFWPSVAKVIPFVSALTFDYGIFELFDVGHAAIGCLGPFFEHH